MRHKQPASEGLQKWMLFALAVVITAMGYQNIQITGLIGETRAMLEILASNGRDMSKIEKRIDNLEQWRYNVPLPSPNKISSVPKLFVLPDRRKFHLYRDQSLSIEF